MLTTGFRRGERWALQIKGAGLTPYSRFADGLAVLLLWMALTVLLTWNAIQHPGYGTPVPIISGSILFVLWVAFLAMIYGKFFRQ